jgi:hypothetical protein
MTTHVQRVITVIGTALSDWPIDVVAIVARYWYIRPSHSPLFFSQHRRSFMHGR